MLVPALLSRPGELTGFVERYQRWLLIVILSFTILLRLAVLAVAGPPYETPILDAAGYDSVAQHLVAGDGFYSSRPGSDYEGPTVLLPPGYPFFVALIYWLFGHSYTAVYIAQALLGALTGLFLYLLGKRFFGSGVGLLAALLWAVYPRGVFWSNQILTEALFTFLLAATMVALVYAVEARSWGRYLLTGALLALANLTRPVLLLFPVAILIYLFFRDRSLASLKYWLAMVLMMFAVIAPWTVRNYLVTGEFILIRSMGSFLWITVNDAHSGAYATEMQEAFGTHSSGEAEGDVTKGALEIMLRDPVVYLKNALPNLGILWGITPKGGVNTSVSRFVQWLGLMLLLALALGGGMLACRRRRGVLVLLPILYVIAIHTVLYPDGRYREPYIPYVVLLAALACAQIADLVLDRFWMRSKANATP